MLYYNKNKNKQNKILHPGRDTAATIIWGGQIIGALLTSNHEGGH